MLRRAPGSGRLRLCCAPSPPPDPSPPRRAAEANRGVRFTEISAAAFVSSELRDAHLVARVVEELQPLADVLGGAEEVEQLLVVDLQQRDFDGELGAVLGKLLKDLVQRARDDAGQRVLETQKHGNLFQRRPRSCLHHFHNN